MKHQGQTTSETMSIVSLGFVLMGFSFRYGRGFESSAGRAARRDSADFIVACELGVRLRGARVIDFAHDAFEIDWRQAAVIAPCQGDVRS